MIGLDPPYSNLSLRENLQPQPRKGEVLDTK